MRGRRSLDHAIDDELSHVGVSKLATVKHTHGPDSVALLKKPPDVSNLEVQVVVISRGTEKHFLRLDDPRAQARCLAWSYLNLP